MNEILIFFIVILIVLNFYHFYEPFDVKLTKSTIPSNTHFLKLIEYVLNDINNKYNLHYVPGVIERVKFDNFDVNGIKATNYNFIVFVYETKYFITRKIELDIIVYNKEENHIIEVNFINQAGSLDPLLERQTCDGRYSNLHKTSLGDVYYNHDSKLEYTNINLPETKNKMVKRNNEILPPDALKALSKLNNTNNFNKSWNKDGVYIDLDESYKKNKILKEPFYNPTLFMPNEDSYSWLFDRASDSESRPVGITGARGSSS